MNFYFQLKVGAGVGLMGAFVPFIIKANKKFKKAVDLYNTNPGNVSFKPPVEFQLRSTGKGIGLIMSF